MTTKTPKCYFCQHEGADLICVPRHIRYVDDMELPIAEYYACPTCKAQNDKGLCIRCDEKSRWGSDECWHCSDPRHRGCEKGCCSGCTEAPWSDKCPDDVPRWKGQKQERTHE